MRCEHTTTHDSRQYVCQQNKGHNGTHSGYVLESLDGYGSRFYVWFAWNDDGEFPVERGLAVYVNYREGPAARDRARDRVMYDAYDNLKAGDVFEIRCKKYPTAPLSADYGRKTLSIKEQEDSWGVAWYYLSPVEGFPGMHDKELCWYCTDEGVYDDLGGFVLLERSRV